MTALPQFIKINVLQRFSSGIWLMMGLDTFITIGFSIALPFLALYLHNERAIPMSLVGTIFLIGGLCTAFSNMIGGMLSDRFGRRRLLLIVSSIGIFIYAALALLIGLSASIWSIAFVFIISRGIMGTIQPTISAIVADLSPKDRLTESYALVRVGGNVGFAIGPAIGGYLITSISYGWLLSISAFMCMLITALIYFLFRESLKGNKEKVDFRSTLAVAKDRPFLVFIIFSILLVLSMAHLGTTLSVFTVDRLGFSTSQYGLLLTTNGIVVVIAQYPVAYMVSKLTKANGLILGSLFYVCGYLTLGWITSYNLAILSIVIITAGEVTFSPIASSVVAESATPDKRGRYMGLYALGSTLGFSISPLLGGVLLDLFPSEPRLLWGILAAIGSIGAAGFYVWGKMMGKKPSP